MSRHTIITILALVGLVFVGPAAAASSQRWQPPVGATPVPNVIAAFAPPPEPWLAGHRGVDLAANSGTAVRAAGSGTVTFAGMLAGRGVITVSHGDLRTTYEPVDALVDPGDAVAAGQVIGQIGAGGHCSLRCLHWGLLRGEQYLDPMWLLRLEPPVLKSPRLGGRAVKSRSQASKQQADPAKASDPGRAAALARPASTGARPSVGIAAAESAGDSRNGESTDGALWNAAVPTAALAGVGIAGGFAVAARRSRVRRG